MSVPFVEPTLRRSLSVVYRFYDAFFFPVNDRTPAIESELSVSIPQFQWKALRAEIDRSYRFSALTLREPAPSGVNLAVDVVSLRGDYVNFEPIVVTLPLPVSSPPLRSDFLIARPLWPTPGVRPSDRETAVRGHITSPTAQPVAGLKVEMWAGPSPVPPAGTPYTFSNANGDFLFRFPLLKGAGGAPTALQMRLNNGTIPVSPNPVTIPFGSTQNISFQRT